MCAAWPGARFITMGIKDRTASLAGLPGGGSLLLSCLIALLATVGARPSCGEGAAVDATGAIAPRVYGRLSDGSARNLRLGYALAVEMMRPESPCGALFAPYHAVGVEKLSSTLFAPPTDRERTCLCAGRVSAFTAVGSRVTKLCPEFGTLPPQAAALTLVHEALHSAGMPEGGWAPGALTSSQINALVAGACGSSPAIRGGAGHSSPVH